MGWSNKIVIKELAHFFKSLSDENRLKIILCIALEKCGFLSVTEIVNRLGLSQPLVSHHLKEFRYANILVSERRGPFIYYRLASKGLLKFLGRAVAEINPDLDESALGAEVKRIIQEQEQTKGEE